MKKGFKFKWEWWITGFIVLFLVVVFSGILGFRHKKELYYNYKVTIIEKGGYAERNGKFTNVGKFFLVRSVADTTLYTELSGYNFVSLGDAYGSSLYWSKKKVIHSPLNTSVKTDFGKNKNNEKSKKIGTD